MSFYVYSPYVSVLSVSILTFMQANRRSYPGQPSSSRACKEEPSSSRAGRDGQPSSSRAGSGGQPSNSSAASQEEQEDRICVLRIAVSTACSQCGIFSLSRYCSLFHPPSLYYVALPALLVCMHAPPARRA